MTKSATASCCTQISCDCSESTDSSFNPAEDKEIAALCKALGHPARVAILRRLLSSDKCVFGTLADLVPLAPSTVAQHLAQLRAAGLIRQWDDGANSCYCVETSRLSALREMLEKF
ncbi:metalloregulator ArsR/SmtB family transcription factor [uncultured Sneathiella sp.]|jgi:ArsR family transcriptional regulator|uniref:ArsR/SmtB family transcription factor n=1 Tax=uncultured Sneathiella sp. TaxID=879315 RepID=UPI002591F847|nr:metalloregulator ArsR/SmtB family transcription factor [uncultured Sneathiella sp.]